ncbi:hypothetical protein EAH80_04745 [Mycobacterium hodleri]|uniref:Lipoprotein LprP n=2 Tax=Mycolicibacterium hodleri TaxID=49897 RepID=A0A502ELH9_9MYCO|nr:hypothetical protein EAH80_04745 [Mycolicibacterium hodleri]
MLALVIVALLSVALPSCVKDTTVNPYAAPDHGELDRLQKIINDRPDLEAARQQLTALDGQIRATIAQFSAQTVVGPSTLKPDRGCTDPYGHNIGDTMTVEKIYARPAPTDQQWQQITAALSPILTAANFKPNTPAGVPPAAGTFSWIADDGATIEMINNPGSVLAYGYSTGCRLPAAWRTGQPPADLRPVDDADAHYPYLYQSPGGRSG